jgi:hypothetical protein
MKSYPNSEVAIDTSNATTPMRFNLEGNSKKLFYDSHNEDSKVTQPKSTKPSRTEYQKNYYQKRKAQKKKGSGDEGDDEGNL